MKKKLALLLCLVLLVTALALPASADNSAAWDGSVDTSWYRKDATSFEVSTPAQLAGLAAIVNGKAEGIAQDAFAGKTVKLTADVDLGGVKGSDGTWSGRQWTTIGEGSWSNPFKGTFDGDGHTVSNLYIDTTTASFIGLFGGTSDQAKIKNVIIASGYVKTTASYSYASGLVGYAGGDTVILNCANGADIVGNQNAGGITANISSSGYIANCYNTGKVHSEGPNAGGIAAYLGCKTTNLYNTGAISAAGSECYVGGIVGEMAVSSKTTVEQNWYNTGAVTGTNPGVKARIGALAGKGYGGSWSVVYPVYKNCYYSKTSETVYALGGEATDREGLIAKTAEELKTADLGAGFVADSENVNGGYPILKWQKKTADGKYDYDKDEADGLDIAATGIENATAKGFTAKMTARLEYTMITTGDFTLKVTVDGQEVKPENLSSTVTTDDEATTVAFSWKELPAEKDVVYSVQFKQNPAKTFSFTLPVSDSWIAYAADGFAGGDGSKDDPYRIETVGQLAYFGRVADAFNNKYIVLVNDLDLGGKYWMPKDFAGIFDGQGHTLSNLQVREGVKSNWWSTNSGFFALLGDDNTTEYETKICYVQNLTLKDANVDTASVDSGAILAGRVGNDVIIENCHVSGKITAKYAGGLVGKVTVNNYNEGIDHDYIRRCSVNATVIAPEYYAGGLVSQIDWGNDSYGSLTIEDCYVTGLVQGGYAAGGFLGQTERNRCVTIDHSFVTANVLAPGGTDKLGGVGGFAGCTGITGSQSVNKMVIRNSVAAMEKLQNKSAASGTTSGRIVSQGSDLVDAGKGTFENNYGLTTTLLNGAVAMASINNGDDVTPETIATQAFWTDTVGFDLSENGAWSWDAAANRPVLRTDKMATVAMTITEQPLAATVYNNRSALMSVAVKGGTLGYTYQWQRARKATSSFSDIDDATSSFSDIDDATSSMLEIKKTDSFARDGYFYRCVITDSTGNSVTSDAAMLTVADAVFGADAARQNLVKYYEGRKVLDYAGQAYALAQAGVDLSDYTDTLYTYYGYVPTNNSDSTRNTMFYLYLDAYVRDMDVTDYTVTGSGAPAKENMIQTLLSGQNAETGRVYYKLNDWIENAGVPSEVLALEMYFAGADSWGNEAEGTKLGRSGAIDELLSHLVDYVGGGRVFTYDRKFSTVEDFLTGQADFALLMARLTDDPVYGKQAKAALADVLQAMENLYASGKITYTKSAARYVSAFVAGADQAKSAIKRNHYLSLAEEIMQDAVLPSAAIDGTFSATVGAQAVTGDAEASVAALIALTDYENSSASYVTYTYPMGDSAAVNSDLANLSFADPVTADVTLPAEGRFGSTITWTSTNNDIISAETGKVNRQNYDCTVTLTATATRGDVTNTREFTLNVKADASAAEDAVDAVLRSLSVLPETAKDLTLPKSSDENVTLTWTSSDEAVLAPDGKVTQPESGSVTITLTATATMGDVTKTREFTVLVYAKTTDKLQLSYEACRAKWLSTKEASGYWNVFAAYASLGDYIQDPANGYNFDLGKAESSWTGTHYGAQVLAIVQMGENPYNFRGENWVKLLEKNYGGPWSGGVYSELGMVAAGAGSKYGFTASARSGLSQISPSAMSSGIDIAGWAATIVASHAGEPGVDDAVKTYVDYLKNMGLGGDGNFTGCNYISTACAVMGFAGLYHAGYADCDITAAPWINALTNKTMVDAVYDNNWAGEETIPGYASQATVSICDFYNAKYNNLGNSWFECRVTKARLDKQIAKANEILANKALYTADSVKAIEDAMKVVKGISEERLSAKFADYGEEYYTLYDAVRYAKTAENAVADKAAADAVTALIDALPAAADTTLENADAVAAARAAFDKLTEAQQSLVSADATAKLKDCEAKIADLEAAEADKAAAAKVEETINALPAADKITLENKEAIEAARAAFDALTETQQGLVSKDARDKLAAAEAAIAKLEAAEADKAAAAKVEETINALPAAADITLENKEAVVAARAAYGALTEAQQALVSKEAQDKLTACEARIAELEKPEEPADLPFTDLTQDWYMDSIRYVYEHELMYGTTDTTFAPDDALTRGMFVTMLYRMEGKPEVTGSTSFTDVPAGAYYADAVAWANANGVVYGTSETAFSPDGNITREQMAAMMRRYASFKKIDVTATTDLSGYADAATISSWATADLQWAVASELLYGNNHNALQPTANATRAQAAAILQRFATKIVK
ncbi:MAG: S-layer homology domain-containing protein [Oscillospiraceae bacterium]